MTEVKGPKHLALVHQTKLVNAESIISSQTLNPSKSGMFGPGIYFANTLEATDIKANQQEVYLIAEVQLNKIMSYTKDQRNQAKADRNQLVQDGFDSIIGYGIKSGREILAFNPSQVTNIKYIFGPRPNAQFVPKDHHNIFFIVTSRDKAKKIVEDQKIEPRNGYYGRGIYMYDSITDALDLNHNGENETALAANVYLAKRYVLKSKVDINHCQDIPKDRKTFIGEINGIKMFVFKDPSLIKHIHYIGGQPWNVKIEKTSLNPK